MASTVSVYLQGSDALGPVFGNTSHLNTAVYTLPSTVALLSTAIQRSSASLLVVAEGHTTKASSSQVASTLVKLENKREPIVAYLGAGKKSVFLNAPAVALIKASLTAEPVTVPTRAGDDVPGEETFSPSPVLSRDIPFAAKAFASVDIQAQVDQLITSGAIKTVDVGTLFLVEQQALAPAQIIDYDYKNLMVSSPISDDFQGSPASSETLPATRDIIYYNPEIDTIQSSTTSGAVIVTGDTLSNNQTQNIVNSWWLWLIIVIILVVLLIVSVVLYYRR
jgi:hypothetical protein